MFHRAARVSAALVPALCGLPFVTACATAPAGSTGDAPGVSVKLSFAQSALTGDNATVCPANATQVPTLSSPPAGLKRLTVDVVGSKGSFKYDGAIAAQKPIIVENIAPGSDYSVTVKAYDGGSSPVWFARQTGVTFAAGKNTFLDLLMTQAGVTCPANGMVFKRMGHTATTLPDGSVLLAGGFTVAEKRDSGDGRTIYQLAAAMTAELFDPNTGRFTVIDGDMDQPRALHTATLAPDGKVIIAGGVQQAYFWSGNATAGPIQPVNAPIPSFIVFDPATRRFERQADNAQLVAARPLNVARAMHTATLVPLPGDTPASSWTIVLAGGLGGNPSQSSINQGACKSAKDTFELLGPYNATDKRARVLQCFEAKNKLTATEGRYGHTAALIPVTGGAPQVLLWGGAVSASATVAETINLAASVSETINSQGTAKSLTRKTQVNATTRFTAAFAAPDGQDIRLVGGVVPGNPPTIVTRIASPFAGDIATLSTSVALLTAAGALDLATDAPEAATPKYVLTGGIANASSFASQPFTYIGGPKTPFQIAEKLRLTKPRSFHAMAALPGGAILVTGGWTSPGDDTIDGTGEIIQPNGL